MRAPAFRQTSKRFLFNSIEQQYASNKIYTTLHIFDSFQEIEQTELQSNIRNIRCVSDPSLFQPKWRVVFARLCVCWRFCSSSISFLPLILLLFTYNSSEERKKSGSRSSNVHIHIERDRKHGLHLRFMPWTCVRYWRIRFSLSLSLSSSTYMDNFQYLHHAHTALRSVCSLVRSLITIAVAVCMRPRYTSLITTTTIRLIMNRNDNVTLSSPVYLFLSVARAHNHWSPHYTHHKFSLHLCVCLLFSRYRTFLRYGFLFDLYLIFLHRTFCE